MKSPERKFIHDLATPLAIAQGMTEAVIMTLQATPKSDAETIRRLEKVLAAIHKMAELLSVRRNNLIANQENTDQTD